MFSFGRKNCQVTGPSLSSVSKVWLKLSQCDGLIGKGWQLVTADSCGGKLSQLLLRRVEVWRQRDRLVVCRLMIMTQVETLDSQQHQAISPHTKLQFCESNLLLKNYLANKNWEGHSTVWRGFVKFNFIFYPIIDPRKSSLTSVWWWQWYCPGVTRGGGPMAPVTVSSCHSPTKYLSLSAQEQTWADMMVDRSV